MPAFKQFELLGALVEVVAQGDAVEPALDLPALGPELDVKRGAGLEQPAKGADLDTLCHRSIGKRGQTARWRCGSSQRSSGQPWACASLPGVRSENAGLD